MKLIVKLFSKVSKPQGIPQMLKNTDPNPHCKED